MEKVGVAVSATINRLGSAASGGYKIVLDVPESDGTAVAELLKAYLAKPLSVAFIIQP